MKIQDVEASQETLGGTLNSFRGFDKSTSSEMFNHTHMQGFQGLKQKFQVKGNG
jgi:hypothetical protein